MTKREKEKAAKRKHEIEAVRHELRLLAIGVAGHTAIEDDPNEEIGVYATLGCGLWSRWLSAIKDYWNLRETRSWIIEVGALEHYETLDAASEWLHGLGARAGGAWV